MCTYFIAEGLNILRRKTKYKRNFQWKMDWTLMWFWCQETNYTLDILLNLHDLPHLDQVNLTGRFWSLGYGVILVIARCCDKLVSLPSFILYSLRYGDHNWTVYFICVLTKALHSVGEPYLVLCEQAGDIMPIWWRELVYFWQGSIRTWVSYDRLNAMVGKSSSVHPRNKIE